METVFKNRREAGLALAELLYAYHQRSDVTVLALPRGGVPVGFEVAQALGAPLDVLVVRKLGLPGRPEYAMGALASGPAGPVQVLDRRILQLMNVKDQAVAEVIDAEQRELARRETLYRGGRPLPSLAGRTVIVVDDGLATGSSMLAAVQTLAAQQPPPSRIIVAVPVGSEEAVTALRQRADEVLCLNIPPDFQSVSRWYEDFAQVEDEEVRGLLQQAHPGIG
ncbi:MAG TPA: phosphoribosyltransferase [Ideonella sp.]|uniref:phosphoribosyltransferase n=1 Tax=Ideonella sp. TaxID=1929293 RepID=UPI002C07AEF4|nr:phosphoribosyltransferase [Ideonella sp.]HSI50295.1 phosphoribosyltransferase [Ideonella sp.]